jgi:hypothetical protein
MRLAVIGVFMVFPLAGDEMIDVGPLPVINIIATGIIPRPARLAMSNTTRE